MLHVKWHFYITLRPFVQIEISLLQIMINFQEISLNSNYSVTDLFESRFKLRDQGFKDNLKYKRQAAEKKHIIALINRANNSLVKASSGFAPHLHRESYWNISQFLILKKNISQFLIFSHFFKT